MLRLESKRLFMIQSGALIDRLAGQVGAEAHDDFLVNRGQEDRGMNLAAAQLIQLLERLCHHGVGHGADGQRQKHLIRMQARVAAAQMLHLQGLDRRQDGGRKKLNAVVNSCQTL